MNLKTQETARRALLATFAGAVQRYRAKKDMTQVQLAAACNVSPSTIAAIEGERAMPSFWMIVKITQVLEVEASKLFEVEG